MSDLGHTEASLTPISDAVAEHLDPKDSTAQKWLPWRTGRKVGRTIYAVIGGTFDPHKASDDDPLIGVMDSPELADEAVRAHNAALLRVQHPDFLKGGKRIPRTQNVAAHTVAAQELKLWQDFVRRGSS